MFNKNDSNQPRKVEIKKKNLKKIGGILITTTLLLYLLNFIQVDSKTIDDEELLYRKRVYDYAKERKYDEIITNIYNEYQLNIDGIISPLDKYYITYQDNDFDSFHLINVYTEYSDILSKSMEKYDYNGVVKFRDTTAFINLITSDGVMVDHEKKVVNILNNEKAIDIISKWDGIIHDKVANTDAVSNKVLIRR